MQACLESPREEKWESVQRQREPLAAGRRQMDEARPAQETESDEQLRESGEKSGDERGLVRQMEGWAEKHVPGSTSLPQKG